MSLKVTVLFLLFSVSAANVITVRADATLPASSPHPRVCTDCGVITMDEYTSNVQVGADGASPVITATYDDLAVPQSKDGPVGLGPGVRVYEGLMYRGGWRVASYNATGTPGAVSPVSPPNFLIAGAGAASEHWIQTPKGRNMTLDEFHFTCGIIGPGTPILFSGCFLEFRGYQKGRIVARGAVEAVFLRGFGSTLTQVPGPGASLQRNGFAQIDELVFEILSVPGDDFAHVVLVLDNLKYTIN